MAELEKTIAGLEKCINDKGFCGYDCPYYHDPSGCRTHMEKDALELLKEQQSAYERGKRDGVSQYLRDREEDEEYEY